MCMYTKYTCIHASALVLWDVAGQLDCVLFDVVAAVCCFSGHLFIEISIYLSWFLLDRMVPRR